MRPEHLLQVASTYDYSGVVVCRVSGEIDAYTAPLLDEELQRAARSDRDVVVDLSRVAFFCVAGLRVLDRTRDTAGPRHDVVLAGEAEAVALVLDLVGTDAPFTWCPTVLAAIAACARGELSSAGRAAGRTADVGLRR